MKATAKILAAIAVLGLATSTFGASLTLSTTARSNGSDGGSYTATFSNGSGLSISSYSVASGVAGVVPSNPTLSAFETFCLEPTETFSSGGTYNYTISSVVFGGGADAHDPVNAGDPLSIGTSWLYSQFAQGILTDYTYGTDAERKAANLNLQRAIWYLEDDFGLSGQYTSSVLALGNPFLKLVANTVGTGATTALKLESVRANAAAGLNGVWALNLTSGAQNLTNNQSQLYYNVSSVPEGGATIGLLGLSLLTFAALRRRFASAR